MTAKHLTVASVRSILSRAGVNCSDLTLDLIDRSGTHTGGIYECQYVEEMDVRISGDPEARRKARAVLGERGLWLTPTCEYDDWSRGAAPVATHA